MLNTFDILSHFILDFVKHCSIVVKIMYSIYVDVF